MQLLLNRVKNLLPYALPAASVALLLAVMVGQGLGAYFFLFDLASQFAVQYAVLGTLLAGWAAAKRKWLLVGLNLLVAMSQSALVAPWLLAEPPRIEAGQPCRGRAGCTWRVVHANVLFTRADIRRSLDLVRQQQADVVVLQEMTIEQIPAAMAYFRSTHPHSDTVRSKGKSHILLLSRTPLRANPLPKHEHLVLDHRTTIRGREVRILTVHPRAPILPSWYASRNEQLDFVAEQLQRSGPPTLLIGDFNVGPFSPLYRRWFEQPGIVSCRKGFGLQPTWPRFFPPAYLPIDHAFTSKKLVATAFQTLDQPGSDHKAVRVDLRFVP